LPDTGKRLQLGNRLLSIHQLAQQQQTVLIGQALEQGSSPSGICPQHIQIHVIHPSGIDHPTAS
jgi:hypothetical protein